jgi:hypothetical protein
MARKYRPFPSLPAAGIRFNSMEAAMAGNSTACKVDAAKPGKVSE